MDGRWFEVSVRLCSSANDAAPPPRFTPPRNQHILSGGSHALSSACAKRSPPSGCGKVAHRTCFTTCGIAGSAFLQSTRARVVKSRRLLTTARSSEYDRAIGRAHRSKMFCARRVEKSKFGSFAVRRVLWYINRSLTHRAPSFSFALRACAAIQEAHA